MKNSIGKPYERKVHVQFDEGGTDSFENINTFRRCNRLELSGSTLLINKK